MLSNPIINRYKGLLVVIPTRNRADLAFNAIMSILTQDNCEDVYVLVSDNSTEDKEINVLRNFCNRLNHANLRYIKTPDSMPMNIHWEWIIQKTLLEYDINHITYLTDRMIFKKNCLKEIAKISKTYPDYVVSYDHDTVNDYSMPVQLWEINWTGRLHEVNTKDLLYNVASMGLLHPLPKMLNCIVPRTVFEKMIQTYNNIFVSISPDYYFCFRCLELVDNFIHFDKAVLISYALFRSNGFSYSKGLSSKDSEDFLKSSPDNFTASPWPDIKTVSNAILHEYYTVKKSTNSTKFFDIDKDTYMSYLSSEINEFTNFELKEKMIILLNFYKNEDWRNNTKNQKNLLIIKKNININEEKIYFFKHIKKLISYFISRYKKIVSLIINSKLVGFAILFAIYKFKMGRPSSFNPKFNNAKKAIEFASKFSKKPAANNTVLNKFFGQKYLNIPP